MISKPNYITIVWMVFCIKVALQPFFASLEVFDYVLWAVTIIRFSVQNSGLVFSKRKTGTVICLLLLLIVQLAGILQNPAWFSVRNLFSTLCVALFILNIVFDREPVQIGYIRFFGCFLLAGIIAAMIGSKQVGNLFPGCVIFMLFGYLMLEAINLEQHGKHRKSWANIGITAMIILVTVLEVFQSRARTALTVLLLMLAVLVLLYLIPLSEKSASNLFPVFVLLIAAGTVIYINITSFSWYEAVNEYSLQYFGKNINSSRPYLWSYSIGEMKPWQWLVGRGTGVLPSIERYLGSSFHNSFIQIFIQSGIIGLILLICLLGRFWKTASRIISERAGKIMMAALIGVIVYNCFECTLIQNKVFLGLIQWFVLGVGMRYSEEQKVSDCSAEIRNGNGYSK